MAEAGSPQITKYMRGLLKQYSQLMGKDKGSGSMEFWDVVVLTAADAAQKAAFEMQIEGKKAHKELPLDLPLHVVSDPPGIRVGNGGSTFAALEFLDREYGNEMFKMKILLIHAGGWSQRMPSATVLGKVFSILPHGTPPFQMLDLKLALYWPFVPKMSAGVFLVCADDFLVYNLGNEKSWTIPRNGFTALAHPSSIAVGRTHGVFVISEGETMETAKHIQLLECNEVLQKPNDSRMKSQGALLKGTSHTFADGICLQGEAVYTDSCFYFGADVMEKLLKFKKSVGDLNCEIDAYGDFLQSVGKNATSDYVHNTSNVSQPTDNLIEMRKKVFSLLNGSSVHVLALNASAFIHIGTTKELIHHLCRDEDFQDQMAFERDVFNLWFDETLFEPSINTNENNTRRNKPVLKRLSRDAEKISKYSCVVHSSLHKESTIEEDCFLEFCDFEMPIRTSKKSILSNCQILRSEARLDTLNIPENTFLHTISLHSKDKASAIEYVTVFFRIDDNLKKVSVLEEVESLPFLGSDIGHYLQCQRLQVADIQPRQETPKKQNDESNESETDGKTDQQLNLGEKVSLWRLKLYPVSGSMTSSLENAIRTLNASDGQKMPRLSRKLYSLEDIVKLKDINDMLNFRKRLYQKIMETKESHIGTNIITAADATFNFSPPPPHLH